MAYTFEKLNPDGTGTARAMATMEKPAFDYDFPPEGPSSSMLESAQIDFEERSIAYESHLATLPRYLVHPSLAGRLKEGQEFEAGQEYQARLATGVWEQCDEYTYNSLRDYYRRIVLVPPVADGKEGGLKEDTVTMSRKELDSFLCKMIDCAMQGNTKDAEILFNNLFKK